MYFTTAELVWLGAMAIVGLIAIAGGFLDMHSSIWQRLSLPQRIGHVVGIALVSVALSIGVFVFLKLRIN